MRDAFAASLPTLLHHVLSAGAMPSGTRLVCVDGPAGAGKTSLAERLVQALEGRGLACALVHMDDLYDGWTGLWTVGRDLARGVIEPLAAGEPGHYRRYDWHRGAYAETRTVPVSDVVVVEGVGAGHAGFAALIGALVWVEAPPDVRLARGLDRDGAAQAQHWDRWMADERRLHAEERTRLRAHVVVDSVTGALLRGEPSPPTIPADRVRTGREDAAAAPYRPGPRPGPAAP